MSDAALLETAQAMRTRIGGVVGGSNQVHIGPPIRSEIGESIVALHLFHLQVNAEIRNNLHYDIPIAPAPLTEPTAQHDQLPFDLRFLITVFRSPDPSSVTPNELMTLGKIIQVFQAEPTLPGASVGGQTVRITPEPYPMEEISRIWGLFPQDVYRTSIVYLASPVMVDAGAFLAGEPVLHREAKSGITEDTNSAENREREAVA